MKILYVTTISDTMEFFPEHINMLLDQGHTVDMACNIIKPITSQLLKRGCKVFDMKFQRSPLGKQNYSAYRKLKRLIQSEKYDIVHTHTPVASACVRLACRKMKNVKVIYTVHGFHFYKGAPINNFLVYYPIERLLARYTDVLITINKEDYERATKSFKAGKIEYVPGVGLDTNKYEKLVVDKKIKRSKLGIPKDAFAILSIGELNKNKNHETIIKAIAELNNPNIYYAICGQGPLESYLRDLAKKLGVEKQVKLLGYREDIAMICKIADVFAFPSFREGLSVALMEAMASGLPVICSNIRGNTDLIQADKGGYLVNPNDVDGFAKAVNKVLNNIKNKKRMSIYNMEAIKAYDISAIIESMKKIYMDISI